LHFIADRIEKRSFTMSISTWLSGTFLISQGRRAKRLNPATTSSRRRRTCRPSLEGLEIRLTLSLTTLASFDFPAGLDPYGGLVMDSSGNLYGTTTYGGANGVDGDGTIFEVAHGSGAITTLAVFNGTNGANPFDGLIMDSSGNLYGTTSAGSASSGYGTVFELAHGSGTITTLASFNGTDGSGPYAGLIMDKSGNLYGTTERGGASGDGAVFELAKGSGTITTLASFNGTNGSEPEGALIMDSSGNLYGTANTGGASSDGTVFELAHGSGTITTLASFNGSDGEYPEAALVMDTSGNLYGTTTYNDGTVFELAHGSGAITTLASFNGTDGQAPDGALIMDSSGNLYGTASGGGVSDGTVFELAHGSGTITTLASFNGTNGNCPEAALIMDSSGDLYSTTINGGGGLGGTVFELAHGSGTITTLASFISNGSNPNAGLIMDSSGNLYGTSYDRGGSNDGTVFELAHGSGTITALASFNGTNGENPRAGLIMDSSGNLYGTAKFGGASDDGTVFELAHGSGTITTLASFNGSNGSFPVGGVILDSSGNLWGTTYLGGAANDGTVFELTHGSGTITTLASFNGTNGEGPEDALIMDSSGNLYGTTYTGGVSAGNGTVFELAHGSRTITTLASFNGTDGSGPYAGLIMDGSGNLYGTTHAGGASGFGTVFELAHGSGTITRLASFDGDDGKYPYGGLIMDSSGNLYGTTSEGGSDNGLPSNLGTVFELAHGSGTITTLVSFDESNYGYPDDGLIMDSSGNLYGTTTEGGVCHDGTIFELSGADVRQASQISGSRSSTGADASRTFTVCVPNVVDTTGAGHTGRADLTSNDSTANLNANDTAADIGTDPFSGVVPQKKGKPSITDTLFSSITGSLIADGS
jgi:uncharacterized repeat protein (TIGR03803 family)